MSGYHVTFHISNAITSGCDCEDLNDVKEFIEEELFQANHKGEDSITVTITQYKGE
jgi:hypothetical protein